MWRRLCFVVLQTDARLLSIPCQNTWAFLHSSPHASPFPIAPTEWSTHVIQWANDSHTEQLDSGGRSIQQQAAPLRLKTHMVPIQDVDQDLKRRWLELENRSLEGCPFSSPRFVDPAVRWLTPKINAWLIYVEETSSPQRPLRLAGVFEERPGNRTFPLKHLHTYRSKHSFTDGLLLDSSHAQRALFRFFEYLLDQSHQWHAVAFRARATSSPQNQMMDAVAHDFGLNWNPLKTWQRCAIDKSELESLKPSSWLSKNRRSNIRKMTKKLEKLGDLSIAVRRPEPDETEIVQTFLTLEHQGWRGDSQDSLLSSTQDTEFFHELVSNFAATGQAIISEMTIDGETIFSSSMFQSGRDLAAFKIGWDTNYRECGPAFVHDANMLAQLLPELNENALIDSCCQPDSWCDQMFPSRLDMSSGLYSLSRLGKVSDNLCSAARMAKRLLSSTE